MGLPGSAPLSPASLSAATHRLVRRLLRRDGGNGHEPAGAQPPPVDPLLQAGTRLRQAREAQGLGLRQLAQSTRISTAVIEALERGWRERLPEATYLRTMLPLLERRLALPPGSLGGALPPESRRRLDRHRDTLLRRFTPGSIDVFTSWQGTLLYGLLTLALIYGLNLQQRRLARLGARTVAPLPLPAVEGRPDPAAAAERRLLASHPELKPLRRAEAGQGLARLRREVGPGRTDLSLGELRLRLGQPTRLELRTAAGDTRLEPLAGELALPVLPPFRLRLEPPPEGDDPVRWRDAPLAPADGPGTYRYPAVAESGSDSKPAAASSEAAGSGSAAGPRP